MGYTIVDLSPTLVKIVKFLLNNKNLNILIWVTKPSENNLFRWICNIKVTDPTINRDYRGTGGSNQLSFAFLKSFGEVCETIAMYENRFSSRCGMAAGFLSESSILRAKSELIERDAFVYHYRNEIPFTSKASLDNGLQSFNMATADQNFPTFLVTDEATVAGKAKCLQFGCGTSFKNTQDAEYKAIQEFLNIFLNHKNFPDQCENWWTHPEEIPTKMDFHHIQSRDKRNLDRFNTLFDTKAHLRSEIDQTKWVVNEVQSPAKFFKVYKASHPDLLKLEFGIPEPNTLDLFHPFW